MTEASDSSGFTQSMLCITRSIWLTKRTITTRCLTRLLLKRSSLWILRSTICCLRASMRHQWQGTLTTRVQLSTPMWSTHCNTLILIWCKRDPCKWWPMRPKASVYAVLLFQYNTHKFRSRTETTFPIIKRICHWILPNSRACASGIRNMRTKTNKNNRSRVLIPLIIKSAQFSTKLTASRTITRRSALCSTRLSFTKSTLSNLEWWKWKNKQAPAMKCSLQKRITCKKAESMTRPHPLKWLL